MSKRKYAQPVLLCLCDTFILSLCHVNNCALPRHVSMVACACLTSCQVHLQLGNNRNALEDSQAAVSRDSTATKVLVKSLLGCYRHAAFCHSSRPADLHHVPAGVLSRRPGGTAAQTLGHRTAAVRSGTRSDTGCAGACSAVEGVANRMPCVHPLSPTVILCFSSQVMPDCHRPPGSGGGCSPGRRAATAGARGSHCRSGAGPQARGAADQPWLAHRPASSHHR